MHTLVEQFIEMMVSERGASLATLEGYKTDLERWLDYLQGPPESASIKDVEGFAHFMTQTGWAPTTAARRLSALRQFYKFLLSEEYIDKNPTSLVETPKHQKPLPKTLSEDEVDRLLIEAHNWPDKEGVRLAALLEILYASGLRVSELVSLPFTSAIRAIKSTPPSMIVKGKGSKERLVLLNREALSALKDYLEIRSDFLPSKADSHYLFPSSSQQGYLTRQRLGQLLKDLAIRAKIDPKKLSPHTLRHAFATHLLRHGADLLSVQKLLGHADISTTQIYTHIMHEELAELVETCHPLGRSFQ